MNSTLPEDRTVIARIFIEQVRQLATVSARGDECWIEREPAEHCPTEIGSTGSTVEAALYVVTLSGYDRKLEQLGVNAPSRNGFRVIHNGRSTSVLPQRS